MTTRRKFIQIMPVAGIVFLGGCAGMSYVDDATKIDATKFKSYRSGQICENCVLYKGKAGDATGACQIFSGKLVNANGWCIAYERQIV